ncbi:PREDICTED: uncharacterized protein LOC18611864 isoform X2 [Theobroma cacao]|uniref:Uncharacterized protein LOC18611864 isoform X2 n=1 Tax=Theobroma cacao TaxID=3641 RepID=A0AB32WZ75_THECC|nr:PREDICTED: uncharacterized protein LOC18611864 isoform X2 [Theobroma cacao]
MLKKTDCCQGVVNRKDKDGNTALHRAAAKNYPQMLKLLLACKADKNVTNQAGLTALDVARGQVNNRESINILGVCSFAGVSTLYKLWQLIVKILTEASTEIFQDMDGISSDDRNALLVILGLLLTATYQAILSPPGGVWQGAVFIVAFFLTLGLLKPFPRGFKTALQVLLAFFAICFQASIYPIIPFYFYVPLVINIFIFLVFVIMMSMCTASRVSKISVMVLGCWLLVGVIYQSFASFGS